MPINISHLFDTSLRKLFKNAGVLMSGNVVGAVISLLTLSVLGRYLGAENLGVYFLLTTYVALIDRIFNFQSWQLIIRSGAHALENNDKALFSKIVSFGLVLDVVSAVLSTAVAILGVNLFLKLFSLNVELNNALYIYTLVILFNLKGMPTGVLRTFDKFKPLSIHKIILAVLSLVVAGFVWLVDGSFLQLFTGLVFANLTANAYLFVTALKELQKNNLSFQFKGLSLKEHIPDLWHYIFYTNIESSVKVIRELDVFLVKLFLSAEAVGFYRLARQLAEALNLMIDPFFYAIFPEFSKLVAKKDMLSIKRMAQKSSIVVGGAISLVWLGFLLLGSLFVTLLFGSEYGSVYGLTLVCMLGIIAWAFAQPLSPILYAFGYVKKLFYIHITTALLYIAVLAASLQFFGLWGAVWCYAVFYILWVLSIYVIVNKKIFVEKK